MTGEVLRIGPFVGGLNLASDVSSVADEELVICENFELDIDGSLKSRPPIVRHAESGIKGHKIIGSAVFSGTGYIFSSGINPDTATQGIYRSTDGVTWTEIALGRLADIAIQYRDLVWFPANPTSTASTGLSWSPSAGAVVVSAMPRASHGVVHKERLYLVPGMKASSNTSRLRFSAPADLTSWPGVNFIDVSPGDGETLNALLVYNDNLLLFKDDSVFVLAYDLNPSDAILREINPVLGTTDGDNLVQFENVVYALHDDIVYEIVNYDFSPINIKVPFTLDKTTPAGQTRIVNTALSLIGERLIVKFWAKTYVYDLRVQTWSEWKVTHQPAEQWHEQTKFIRMPNTSDYYSRRAYSQCECVFRVPDKPNANDTEFEGTEKFTCAIRTKDFDMADPVHYKRLFWWSADVLSGDQIIGIAHPISYSFSPNWTDMTMAWQDIPGTWKQPLLLPASVTTIIPADNNYVLQKTTKFDKALRFRKIAFEVFMETSGSSAEAAKLFSLTATVLTKQKITQRVS